MLRNLVKRWRRPRDEGQAALTADGLPIAGDAATMAETPGAIPQSGVPARKGPRQYLKSSRLPPDKSYWMPWQVMEEFKDAEPDPLAAALAYLARGWSVIPLLPASKQAAIGWSEFRHRRMSNAEATEHWTAHPDHGVGIVTGSVSRLVVLDLHASAAGDPLAASADCPTGYAVSTGSGGLHLYFRHPGRYVPCGSTARPGINRVGDGGYVVAPPSTHPDGTAYLVLEDDAPGDLPAWAATGVPPAAARAPEPAPAVETRPEAVEPEPESTPPPVRTAIHPAPEPPPVVAAPAATEPPRRLRAVVDPAPTLPPDAEQADDAPDAIARILSSCRSTRDRAKAGEEAWLIPYLLPRAALIGLAGAEFAGVSRLLSDLVCALVNGSEVFGERAHRTRVVWFTERPPATFAQLIRRHPGLDRHEDLFVVHHHEVVDVPWRDRIAGIGLAARRQGANLLVVDTFPRVMNLRAADTAPVDTALEDFAATVRDGLSLLLVHRGPILPGTLERMDTVLTLRTGDREAPAGEWRLVQTGLGSEPTERAIYLDAAPPAAPSTPPAAASADPPVRPTEAAGRTRNGGRARKDTPTPGPTGRGRTGPS